MAYSTKQTINEYLNHIMQSDLKRNRKLKRTFKPALLKRWLNDSRPTDESLIQISEALNLSLTKLYWLRIRPDQRVKIDENASLTLATELMVDKYLKNMHTNKIVEKLDITLNEYDRYLNLRLVYTDRDLQILSKLYQVDFDYLQKLNQPLKYDKAFHQTAAYLKTLQTQKAAQVPPLRKNVPNLINNLKVIMTKHPKYHTVQQILRASHVSPGTGYNKFTPGLDGAIKLARFFDTDLQTLLMPADNSTTNQLFPHVQAYAKQNHLTIKQVMDATNLSPDYFIGIPANSYLNGLIKIARVIPTTIDNLVKDPHRPDVKPKPFKAKSTTKPTPNKSVVKTKIVEKPVVQQLNKIDQTWLNLIHPLNADQKFLLKSILQQWNAQN